MALPVTSVYALLVCLLGGFAQPQLWAPLVVLTLSAYLMVELNNSNALIRIYSRMVSCSYLVLMVMARHLIESTTYGVVQLCFIAFFLFFFRAYQSKRGVGMVFYAFIMLGVCSIFFVQALFFVPVLWVLLYTNIMARGVRSYVASIVGLVVPYWFWGGYGIYVGDVDRVMNHINPIMTFGQVCDFASLDVHQIVNFAFVALVSIIGMVHFHRNSYKDKIRTRMLYEVFTVMCLCIIAFIVLQPQHIDYLTDMLIVCASPLIGHYISLTNTRITNISFIVLLVVALSITVFNLWIL